MRGLKMTSQATFNNSGLRTTGTLRRKAASMLFRLAALAGVVAALAPSASAAGKVRKQADFNGDGYADLAIGAPGEGYVFGTRTGVSHISSAGVVHVAFGSPGGLVGRNQLLSRSIESKSSIFRPMNYARFGDALAWGDFNKDGFDDLAVGVPGDRNSQGSVDIYKGSSTGLAFRPVHLRIADMRVQWPANPTYTAFGKALATGDVNGDGYADLAISQHFGLGGRGAVYVVPGGATGLNPKASQTLNGVGWTTGSGPLSLVFGDFNGDGCFDLAMGFPYVGRTDEPGMVLVGYGTPYGIDSNPQVWSQDSPGIPGICEAYDQFGYSLTTADFNDDGWWDLVIGAPGENSNSGVVHVLFGLPGGLSNYATQIWSQDSPDVYEIAEPGDRFGESLATANVDASGTASRYPELIVGIPGENAGAGGIQVLSVITVEGLKHQFWSQDSYQVLGYSEAGDRFGSSLAVGDFNGDGSVDVAIGVPGEDTRSGAVNVLYGAGSGLSWPGNQILTQGFPGLLETPEDNDNFGRL